ncbi:MAG: DUF1326 domain-containing protein [Isosphaeraceae bacterium]|nr:DUF1326 domain-containing protein [Isosphaeraceae bacterium]
MLATAALCGALALLGATPAKSAQIEGDYIEARTADVYTGPCFSNAEVFITGDKAVLAWKVNRGSWNGVDLSGLIVAAAVRGTTTFSEDRPEEARSVLIVDQKATPQQREALIALAKHLAGARLSKIAEVKTALMSLTVEDHHGAPEAAPAHRLHQTPHAPRGQFWAPGLASILTRPLDESDHACGNEVVAYEPLSQGVNALPAYTLAHRFAGKGLDARWDDPNCRSSFVGHFSY